MIGEQNPPSKYKCPHCGHVLHIDPTASPLIKLYCPTGPCDSKAADKGQIGETEQEAFEKLELTVAKEEDAENDAEALALWSEEARARKMGV